MQDAPDIETLLLAVARFLDEEVRPALSDPALSFRARIASHLCTSALREIEREEADDAAELSTLNVLFADEPSRNPPTKDERRARIRMLNERLVARLRADDLASGERSHLGRHVRETLRAKLAVNNPKFDLARDLPGDTDGLPPPAATPTPAPSATSSTAASSSSVFPPASEG